MSRYTNASNKQPDSSLSRALLLLALLLVLAPVTAAQEEGAPVLSVAAVVDGIAAEEEVMDLIPIKAGDPFSRKAAADSLRRLYATGLFSDVRIDNDGREGIRLTYVLARRYSVRRIIFFGSDNLPRRSLNEGLYSLREGDPFSESRLSRAEGEIRNILHREGYLQAGVQSEQEKVPSTSQLDILFDIDKGRQLTVSSIVFVGDVILNRSRLHRTIKTRVGEPYIPALLEKDVEILKQMYHDQDYRQIEISVSAEKVNEKTGTVDLTLEVFPRDKIEIIINGAEVPLELLKPIWEARIFEEWGLSEGEAKIQQYLRKKGFLFAKITSSIQRENNAFQVIHTVDKGRRYKLKKVEFSGNDSFDDERLKEELDIHDNIPLIGGIDGARLFELPTEMEYFYMSKGFPDPLIHLQFKLEEETAVPIFQIEEGRREVIESIAFEGESLFDGRTLLQQISSVENGPFVQIGVQKDIWKIEEYYLNEGVRGSEINVQVERLEGDRFSVRFRITEGIPVRINSIMLSGNDVTRKRTILREVLLKPGDKASYALIRESKRRLEKLGIFSDVKIEEIQLDDGTENLHIRVLEGDRNYISLGLGLETETEPRTFAIWDNPYRLRGTLEFIRSNIFGTANQFSVVGQLSIQDQRLVVSWEQPTLFGLPLESYLNGWIERERRTSYSFDRRGISLSSIKTIADRGNLIFLGTMRLTRTTLFELEIPESEVDRQHFPYSTTSISGSFIWDRRDDPFNPQKGFFLSSVIEWAYPLFDTESDYQKLFTKYQGYQSLLPGVMFSSTIRMGLGRGRMPIHERFFGGGSNSFRGVEFDGLGPRDPVSTKPVGGKGLLIFNFELTYPLLKDMPNLAGVVFYDVGNVFGKRSDLNFDGLRNAAGLGLRYKTPLGPVRFEIGWNLNGPVGERKARIFITLGNVF